MADRFEQWSRARLGEYASHDGETYATIIVPVDDEQHDPRVDVIAAMAGPSIDSQINERVAGVPSNNVPAQIDREVMRELQPVAAEKPPTTRHRKTRGK